MEIPGAKVLGLLRVAETERAEVLQPESALGAGFNGSIPTAREPVMKKWAIILLKPGSKT